MLRQFGELEQKINRAVMDDVRIKDVFRGRETLLQEGITHLNAQLRPTFESMLNRKEDAVDEELKDLE